MCSISDIESIQDATEHWSVTEDGELGELSDVYVEFKHYQCAMHYIIFNTWEEVKKHLAEQLNGNE